MNKNDKLSGWQNAIHEISEDAAPDYVLVPRVPTKEMAQAMTGWAPIEQASFEARYTKMLAAAPAPAVGGESKDDCGYCCPTCGRDYQSGQTRAKQSPAVDGDAHPDDLAVDAFAAAMKEKMAAARAKGRGGWEDKTLCSQTALSEMLIEHVAKGDPRDVANFCMMLWARGEPIVSNPPKKQADAFLHNGKRVEWEDNIGNWHTGTITGYNSATYNVDLDDGTQAEGYARGRFREIAAQAGGE